MCTRKYILVIIGIFTAIFSTAHKVYARDFVIGNVKENFATDTVCPISPTGKNNLMAVYDENYIWININGKDLKLKLISNRMKKGKRFVRKYQSKTTLVTIDFKETKVSKGEEGDCSNSSFSGLTTIDHNGNIKKVDSIMTCIYC
jgi:hypothetical protein